MRKNIVTPVFRMSFADLAQQGDKVAYLIGRDAAELATYGVDAARLALVKADTLALKDFPPDVFFQAAVSAAVENRDGAAVDIKDRVRNIMVRARSSFGDDSANYRAFGTKGLEGMKHNDLFRCGRLVVYAAGIFFAQLHAKGMEQLEIDDLKAVLVQYDNFIDEKNIAVIKRDLATSQRVALGNKVYAHVTEIFDFGKTYWGSRDEAKYNDYIIYNTPDLKKPEPGQYGAVHGTMVRTDNGVVPDNGLVFLDGVVVPIEVDEDGYWEMDTVPVICKKIRATADNCTDMEADIEILPDDDINFDILMEPIAPITPVPLPTP